MEIIIADKTHIPDIARLEGLCFDKPWSEVMVAETMENSCSRYFLALEGERVLGYAGIQTVLDEGYITNIAVDPDRRRQGIADRLVKAVLACAEEKKLSFVTLEVRVSNSPAIALYKKHGFEGAGRRKGYYLDTDEDALLLTFTL